MALARLVSYFMNAVRTILTDITVVACPGPPSVSAWIIVKFCSEPMIELISRKKVVGDTSGMTTFLTLCHLVAPSIWAASISSVGTPCSAPRYTTIFNPTELMEIGRAHV